MTDQAHQAEDGPEVIEIEGDSLGSLLDHLMRGSGRTDPMIKEADSLAAITTLRFPDSAKAAEILFAAGALCLLTGRQPKSSLEANFLIMRGAFSRGLNTIIEQAHSRLHNGTPTEQASVFCGSMVASVIRGMSPENHVGTFTHDELVKFMEHTFAPWADAIEEEISAEFARIKAEAEAEAAESPT